MKKGLNKKEKELIKHISKILWYEWDPIGLHNEQDEWSDEYDGYVPSIFNLLIEGRDGFKVSNHLTKLASENMGLNSIIGNEHDCKVAKKLIDAKIKLIGE
ncbi:MAG: hypothetical protein R3E90_04500 [Marinicella sp.]|nr:hypothetical protein [Xanthomonadales bacterium]